MIGRDNWVGRRAALLVDDVERLQRALAVGTPAQAVAEAFGVNVRTVYRYRMARIVRHRIEGHVLTFIVWRPGAKPQQIDEGRRAQGAQQRREALQWQTR